MNTRVPQFQTTTPKTTRWLQGLLLPLLIWAILLCTGVNSWAVTTSVVSGAPASPITGYYASGDAGGWQWRWTTDTGRRDVGQTFTAAQDFMLDKFALRINNGVSGTSVSGVSFVYKLYTFSSNTSITPGTLVSTSSGTLPTYTSTTSPYAPNQWLVFDVPDTMLNQGQTYGFVLSFNAAALNQGVTFTRSDTNLYSGGTGVFTTDGTTWSRQASYNFGVYAAAPTPLNLQTLINNAITANPTAPTVTLTKGIYNVTSNLTKIQNATNFTLDGSGSTLIFPPGSWALAALNVNGITVKNFKVDYAPLPFTQGTITAISGDKKQIDFTVNAGYPALDTFGSIKQTYAFDGTTRNWKVGVPDMYPTSTSIVSAYQGRFNFSTAPQNASLLQVGDHLVMTQRIGDAIKFTAGTTNVTMTDVTIFTAPGSAVTGRYLSGTNKFTRVNIERGPLPSGASQPRLISSGADGLHYSFSRSGPQVDDCDFGWMGDDAINIYGSLMPVLRVDNATEFWTARPYAADYTQYLPQANDGIRVMSPNNYAVKATPTLQAFQLGTYTPALTPAQLAAIWLTDPSITTATYYKVTVDSTAGMAAGDWIDIPNVSSPNFTIENSYFHDHRARGFRIQASNGVINNNQLARIKQSAMTFGPMHAYWRETGWVTNVTVSNNTITNVASDPSVSAASSFIPGAISVFAQPDSSGFAIPTNNANISFTGNTINGSTVSGIHVNAASGVTISGNSISNCNTVNNAVTGTANGLSSGYAISINNSTGTNVGTNTFGTAGAYQIGNVMPH